MIDSIAIYGWFVNGSADDVLAIGTFGWFVAILSGGGGMSMKTLDWMMLWEWSLERGV